VHLFKKCSGVLSPDPHFEGREGLAKGRVELERMGGKEMGRKYEGEREGEGRERG
jgi:hypothetical protein